MLDTNINTKDKYESLKKTAIEYFNVNEFYYAENYFTQALEINKCHEAYMNLAKLELKICDYDYNRFLHCMNLFKEAFKLKPNDATPLAFMASKLLFSGFPNDALLYAQKAYQVEPTNPDILLTVASLYISTNRKEAGLKLLEKCISVNPKYAMAYYNYVSSSKVKEDHPITKSIVKLIKNSRLDEQEKSSLNFALANIYHNSKDYEKAWKYYEKANSIKHKMLKYDMEKDRNCFNVIKKIFSKEFFKNNKNLNIKTEKTPIFILGMPRSGTTLTEQIISSHSEVCGIGESVYTRQIFFGPIKDRSFGKQMLEFSQKSEEELQELAKKYTNLISLHIPNGEKFFTDKLPHNFLYIGLIKYFLPNAKFIHCTRNPASTCFSIFTKDLKGNHKYSYDLETLGKYYKMYEDIMEHWEDIFGEDIYESNYEELVNNPDEQIKALISHCDLEWQDSCLDFHKNDRAVMTASNDQVNKKLYKGSNATWKEYEPYLEALIKELGVKNNAT